MVGLVLAAVAGAVTVGVAAWVIQRQATRHFREQTADLNGRLAAAEAQVRTELDRASALAVELAAERQAVVSGRELQAEREVQYRRTLAEAETRFRELAQRVLEEREAKLRREGTEPLRNLVGQLKADIDAFRRQVAASEVETAKTRTSLENRIETLVLQTNSVTEQANNLAGAIRGDAQVTGEWGEIQLKRVLDLAGLSEPTDYTYQETFREDGSGRRNKRTDFVVKMPGDRALIIDSKSTVAAVERYQAAATAEARKLAETDIIASVRAHVDEIDLAEYQASVPNAFPTVLMYVPLEEVYLLAMKATVTVGGERELLRDYARRRNVVLVNSTSVVPVVRLVEMMWNVERSEKNRHDIIRAAEELLQRTNGFIEEFLAVGDAFRDVFRRYETAKAGLVDAPGAQSIAKAVAKLVRLGVKPRTRGGKDYELAAPVRQALES